MPNMKKFDTAVSECRLQTHFHYGKTDRQKGRRMDGQMHRDRQMHKLPFGPADQGE